MSERCSHFLFRSPSDCRLAAQWMALINQFPLGKCEAVVRITEWVGRGNQGRRTIIHFVPTITAADQIKSTPLPDKQCATPTLLGTATDQDDIGFTTVILLLFLLPKMWPQEFLPSLLLRGIPEGTFMTPCASLSPSPFLSTAS